MFSVHKAASISYYLGVNANNDPERTLFGTDESKTDPGNYYNDRSASDPLKTMAIWTGRLANQLGYPPGTDVKQSVLTALWFGIDPRDGETPLAENGPSQSDQAKANNHVAQCESNLAKARSALYQLSPPNETGIDVAPSHKDTFAVLEARAKVEAAVHSLKEATGNKAYRQDAHDCTFSAPKGVSVYWARLKADGGEDAAAQALALEKAMMDSVRAVIDHYIEPQLLFTRHRGGGNQQKSYEHVKGIAAALFMHFDSRPTHSPSETASTASTVSDPDPQMHVHALLMSMGLDHDDEVQALWTTFLGSHAKAIGAAFRGELAVRLQKLGLVTIPYRQGNVTAFDLAGVSDQVAHAFSNRRNEILAHRENGLTSQEAVKAGRISKIDLTGAQMIESWKTRMDDLKVSATTIAGTNLDHLCQAAADNAISIWIAGSPNRDPESAQGLKQWNDAYEKELKRLNQAPPTPEEALAKLMAENSYVSLIDLSTFSFEASQFCHRVLKDGQSPLAWAEEYKCAILKLPDLIMIRDADQYGRARFTSQSVIEREDALYGSATAKLLQARDDRIESSCTQEAITNYEATRTAQGKGPDKGAFKLSDAQRAMVTAMVESAESIHIALAPAGCGKTTAAAGAVRAFEAQGGHVYCLAPSNKAAQQLARDLAKESNEGMAPQALLMAIKNDRVTLKKSDVLFVDEASMLGFDEAEMLVQAAQQATGGPCRIVLMGDTEQLASVGRGNFLCRMVELAEKHDSAQTDSKALTRLMTTLGQWDLVARQEKELGKQATAFFALGNTARALDIFERMGALKTFTTRTESMQTAAHQAYLPLVEPANAYGALTATITDHHRALSVEIHQAAEALRRQDGVTSVVDNGAILQSFAPDRQAEVTQWFAFESKLRQAKAAMHASYGKILMIASKNADVTALNTYARARLMEIGALGGIDGTRSISIARGRVGTLEVAEGERIIFNEKAEGVRPSGKKDKAAKSEVGTVIAVWTNANGEPHLRVQIDGRKDAIDINAAHHSKFSYAYALTTHASQGTTCDHVHEVISDFSAKELSYVTKSRYRKSHTIYAVATEYALYKEKASVSIEKTEASDHALVDLMFSHLKTALTRLDKTSAQDMLTHMDAERSELADHLKESRQRVITQGVLVEHGQGTVQADGPPSYFVKVLDGSTYRTLWGTGLQSVIENMNAQPGDYLGLEMESGRAQDGSTLHWKGYSAGQLEHAGLRLDDEGRDEAAARWIDDLRAKSLSPKKSWDDAFSATMLSLGESKAIASATLTRLNNLSAQQAVDHSLLAAANQTVTLPENLDAMLARAAKALPSTVTNADVLRARIQSGIVVQNFKTPLVETGRTWLLRDAEMAYCTTTWGTVEAWSRHSLSQAITAKLADPRHDIQMVEKQVAAALAKATGATPATSKQLLTTQDPQALWNVIETKLKSPWGLCFHADANAMGIETDHPSILLEHTLREKAADIVRWDAKVEGTQYTQEWEMCSPRDTDGQVFSDKRRELSGIVLHEDAQDIFLVRGQRILAIEKSALGLAAGESLEDQSITITFPANGTPTLTRNQAPKTLAEGRTQQQSLNTGSSLPPHSSVAAEYLFKSINPSPLAARPSGYAFAWADKMGNAITAAHQKRSSDMSERAKDSLPLDMLSDGGDVIKKARIVEIGERGVLIRANKFDWLIDRAELEKITPHVKGRSTKITRNSELASIPIKRDANGLTGLDSSGTRLVTLAQVPQR